MLILLMTMKTYKYTDCIDLQFKEKRGKTSLSNRLSNVTWTRFPTEPFNCHSLIFEILVKVQF